MRTRYYGALGVCNHSAPLDTRQSAAQDAPTWPVCLKELAKNYAGYLEIHRFGEGHLVEAHRMRYSSGNSKGVISLASRKATIPRMIFQASSKLITFGSVGSFS